MEIIIIMNTFTFKAKGQTFTTEAETAPKAMTAANAHFGVLPQGAWMDTSSPNTYRWATGNFLD